MALQTKIEISSAIEGAIEKEIQRELEIELEKVVDDFKKNKAAIVAKVAVRLMSQIKVDSNESEFIIKFNAPR